MSICVFTEFFGPRYAIAMSFVGKVGNMSGMSLPNIKSMEAAAKWPMLTCWWPCKIRQRENDSTFSSGMGSLDGDLQEWVLCFGDRKRCLFVLGFLSTGGTRRLKTMPHKVANIWLFDMFLKFLCSGAKWESKKIFRFSNHLDCDTVFSCTHPAPTYSLIHCSRLAKSAKFVLFLFFDITQYYIYTYTYVWLQNIRHTYTYIYIYIIYMYIYIYNIYIYIYIIEGSLEV